jgi:exopolysaccharide biosynthesis polyprenyl glycosylphosphotransferase
VINPVLLNVPPKNKSAIVSTAWQPDYWQPLRFAWIQWQCYTAEIRCYSLKRAFDVLVSGMLLLLFSPVFFLVAVFIRLDSPGNTFFYQNRVGKDGKTFKMWKFRSMYLDAEKRKAELLAKNEMAGGVIFKMKHDPRVTAMGHFIRKYSIDELPQLLNVFMGDMSLVGPRPPVPSEVALYTAYQRQRLSVTPGITCIWQVSGRSEIPFEQQVEMDLLYINTQSFWLDMMLLFKTIPAVMGAKGAY